MLSSVRCHAQVFSQDRRTQGGSGHGQARGQAGGDRRTLEKASGGEVSNQILSPCQLNADHRPSGGSGRLQAEHESRAGATSRGFRAGEASPWARRDGQCEDQSTEYSPARCSAALLANKRATVTRRAYDDLGNSDGGERVVALLSPALLLVPQSDSLHTARQSSTSARH